MSPISIRLASNKSITMRVPADGTRFSFGSDVILSLEDVQKLVRGLLVVLEGADYMAALEARQADLDRERRHLNERIQKAMK